MESVEELCDYIALINKAEKIMEGPKKDIKEAYRTNTFVVEHKNAIINNGQSYSILSKEELDDKQFRTTIKLDAGINANQLLSELIKQVEIHSFVEKVPTMNEIFIKAVTGNKDE